MQKVIVCYQVRLSSYDPDFGTNAIVDSVVLQMKPFTKQKPILCSD